VQLCWWSAKAHTPRHFANDRFGRYDLRCSKIDVLELHLSSSTSIFEQRGYELENVKTKPHLRITHMSCVWYISRIYMHTQMIMVILSQSNPTARVYVTETPAGISAAPLRYRHNPLLGAPVSAHGRDACLLHQRACVCDPRDAAVTCPARRGCHSCDGLG